jgi:hypothetical protein
MREPASTAESGLIFKDGLNSMSGFLGTHRLEQLASYREFRCFR